ncbi:MAG: hypothetical protein KDC87_16815 [Planctomycetes bacterium]|nr:hypothetical protein [Planctomycetota bacterium]
MDKVILTTAIILAGLAGVFLAPALIRHRGWQAHCTAFAAGVLLAVILSHVVPESMPAAGGHGGAVILCGFIGMMLLQQKVLKADPCCGHEHAKHAGLPSYLALVACSINDGLILSAIPTVQQPLFWAMCGHKITASFALVMLLRETSAGLRGAAHLAYMLLFVAVTPAVIWISGLSALTRWMPYAVAAGAGALLYVICGGLVPRVEHRAQGGHQRVLLTFLIGALITVGVEMMSPHHHHHH